MGRFGLLALGWLCQRAPWILETLLLVLPRIELYCREVIPHAVSESCKRNVSPESRRELAGKEVLLRHIGTAIIQLLRAPSNFLYLRVHLHWLFQGDEGKLIHTLSWKKRKKKKPCDCVRLGPMESLSRVLQEKHHTNSNLWFSFSWNIEWTCAKWNTQCKYTLRCFFAGSRKRTSAAQLNPYHSIFSKDKNTNSSTYLVGYDLLWHSEIKVSWSWSWQ